MKKLFTIALAILLTFALSITAMAATITVNDPKELLTDHTFVAYQILKGDYDASTKTLSNVAWGDGIDYDDLVAALQQDDYDDIFANAFDALDATKISCASDLAGILKNYSETSVQIEKFIELALANLAGNGTALNVKTGTDLSDGYYLIVDTTDVDGVDQVANAALLQVAGENIEINAKVDKPPLIKKVKENVEYTADAGYGAGYNDVANYSIGDVVPFALYSAVPDLTQYEFYEMSFHDNLSKGLTLDLDSLTVTIGGVEIVKGTTSGGVHTGDYHVAVTNIDVSNEVLPDVPAGNTVFNVHIPDLKTIQISDGADGTRAVAKGDEIIVSYNAILDEDAVIGLPGNTNSAYLEFSNDPDNESFGKTPDDKVIVFTCGLELDKVDGANTTKKLKGVEFVVWKDSSKSAFAVIDQNQLFDGWIATSTLTDVNEDGLVDPYDFVSDSQTAVLVTDINGNVTVKGLDDGTYYIEETKELAGYNAILGLMELTIDSTTINGQSWDFTPAKALTGLASDADGDWLAEKQIVNYGGTVLPETGGVGTVIFITVGCVLILCASIVMVTRKKMSVYES